MSPESKPALLAVVGAGAWGTVLAGLLARNGHQVKLWARRPEVAEAIARTGANPEYAAGFHLGENVAPTSDLGEAVDTVEAIFLAVPSKALRSTLERMREHAVWERSVASEAAHPPAIVSCAKGIEVGTFKRFSQVIGEYMPSANIAAISGPNLATEIAAGLPAAATIAAPDEHLAISVQTWLQQVQFRMYRTADIAGVEVAGAMKNVVAIAAGMADGLGLGDNAKAMIVTRGLAEIARLGTHLGGELRTFYGLAGLGDLVATCASPTSRNHTAGVRIANGASLEQLTAQGLNAEGIPTVQAVVAYATRQDLDLPIAAAVHRVIFAGISPQRALVDLMTRELRPE